MSSVAYQYFDNVSLDVTAAARAPSTWAMIILGFAGVGLLAHRRRQKGALNAARALFQPCRLRESAPSGGLFVPRDGATGGPIGRRRSGLNCCNAIPWLAVGRPPQHSPSDREFNGVFSHAIDLLLESAYGKNST